MLGYKNREKKPYWMGVFLEMGHAFPYAFSANVLMNNCKNLSKRA